jgi:hypothetical protein
LPGHLQISLSTKDTVLRRIIVVTALLAVAGCEHKRSEAVVLEKEHIAAHAPFVSPTPAGSPESPDPSPAEEQRELAPDEIVVETYVMKADARGTERDPRALSDEQWLVTAQTTSGRVIKVHASRSQYEKVSAGDRVNVSYRVGKYTGTVWAAELN